jgi:hypothetical protein
MPEARLNVHRPWNISARRPFRLPNSIRLSQRRIVGPACRFAAAAGGTGIFASFL